VRATRRSGAFTKLLLQWKKQKALHISVCGEKVSAQAWACACAPVTSIKQHATRHNIVFYGLSGSTTFFYIISQNGTIFGGKKKKLPNTKCVSIFSTTFIWNISHSKENSAR
jgi:hypothetical protein